MMNKQGASEEATSRATVPDIMISDFGVEGVIEPSRPNFSYGVQLDAPNPDIDDHEDSNAAEAADWLMEATVDLSQDLDTSKKELDIIKFILEEMEMRPRAGRRQNRTREGQAELMRACREFSSSRCHMLRERLRQVQFWAHTRMMGQQVPEKAPDEWRLVDNQWRKWLGEQASSHTNQAGGSRVSPLENTSGSSDDVALGIWGPLPHILNADIWWKDL
ncbi:hypothetical protein F5Y10DRAFT_288050 [Nemania abortiva]|nr:hypothetical protein F5Y10DRAFT_288050 [Nemania abortiva]